MAEQLQLKVRLVCPPPPWFVASISDGITREDDNLTDFFFFFFFDLGGLALREANISEILLLVSGVTKPRIPISIQVRLQLYPF